MKVVGGLNSGRLLKVLKDGLTKEDMYQPNLKCLVGRKVSVTISPFWLYIYIEYGCLWSICINT